MCLENFRENAAAIASIIDRQMSEKRLNQLKGWLFFRFDFQTIFWISLKVVRKLLSKVARVHSKQQLFR